ncbi:LexA family protein [Streptomyces sp. YJ-C3]
MKGDSMAGAHVLDGDTVIIRVQETAGNGEVVAATLEGEATVRLLKRDGAHVWPVAENPAYAYRPYSAISAGGKVRSSAVDEGLLICSGCCREG